MSDETEQLLRHLAAASHELGKIIQRLEVMIADDEVDGADKEGMKGSVLALRSDRRNLDAQFLAIQAGRLAMPGPSNEVLNQLRFLTSTLAREVAEAETSDALLRLATSIVVAARRSES